MSVTTSFGLPFFLRVAVPGLFFVAVAAPLMPEGLTLSLSSTGLAAIGALAAAAGVALYLLDSIIYDLHEGRAFWPAGLRNRKTSKWEVWLNARWTEISRLEEESNRLEQAVVPDRAQILRVERDLGLLYDRVLDFPFAQDGRPHAIWPTRFGNVMSSYEYYPESRYGMDSAFYWYRLWLIAPDDVRKEYETVWSIGQVWLYVSSVSLLAVVAYSALTLWVAAQKSFALLGPVLVPGLPRQVAGFLDDPWAPQKIISWVGASPGVWDWRVLPALGGLVILAFVVWAATYRLAILQHRVSGEFFKSLFDVYREELEIQPFRIHTEGDWEDAANYLQYRRGGSVISRRKRPQ